MAWHPGANTPAEELILFAFIGSRHDLLAHLPRQSMSSIVEVGVCQGINAQWLLDHLQPDVLCLVDPWQAYATADTPFYYLDGPEVERFVEDYLGGPSDQQSTFDRLYEKTRDRFANDTRVIIHRKSSRQVAAQMDDKTQDLIYIDGDHSYEAVIDDLFRWESKLKDGGYLVLNDHVMNPSGSAKYGVVQAVGTFLRNRPEYHPIALNLSNYGDLIIGKKTGNHSALLTALVQSNKIVEIPDAILSNFHRRKSGDLSWLSFC